MIAEALHVVVIEPHAVRHREIRAERVLGFRPRYSNRDALLRNFEWYLANRMRFEQSSGISHRAPWKQGILRVAKAFF